MKKMLSFLLMFLMTVSLSAKLTVDTIFSPHMVLQQEKPIAFFGTAGANLPITATFAGKTVKTQSDAKGSWRVEFPAMKGGRTSYAASFNGDGRIIWITDILIGEVWFCSGQSNMAMPVGRKFHRGWSAQNCEKEVAAADYPEIRYAFQALRYKHGEDLPAKYARAGLWVKCSPKTVDYFSATSYFFGRKLHQDLDIPIGLINASWSGTRIQPWISPEGFEKYGPKRDADIVKKFQLDDKGKQKYAKQENDRYIKELGAWHAAYSALMTSELKKNENFILADFDDSKWGKGNQKINWKPNTRLYRQHFKLQPQMQGKDLQLTCNKIADVADIYLNGKRIGGWAAAVSFPEKKAVINIPASAFNQNGDNLLAVKGDFFFSWQNGGDLYNLIHRMTLKADNGKKQQALKNWKQLEIFSCFPKKIGPKAPSNYNIPYNSQQFPTNLYRGMVQAWTKLPIRGVIWYQGCSNSGDPSYYLLHKTLIADWRDKWNNPEMPFLIVQLAGFGPGFIKNWKTANPNQNFPYALTRDIQLQMLKLKNVGLACAIDIGEAGNIHPANKQDVGYRLGLEAERIVYGKNIVSRGPLFLKAVPEGKTIRVFFDYSQSGLKTSDGQAPGAFAVAGADKKFVWADARIDGKTVVVSSPSVASPKFVRYAYAAYRGDCNLQNAEGLPAYPFRSDAYDYSKVK